MGSRIGLHDTLVDLLSSFGIWFWDPFNFEESSIPEEIKKEAKEHVHFQPPSGFQMTYPCIVYELMDQVAEYADNQPYRLKRKYRVTVIDPKPDSVIADKIALLPCCAFDRFYTVDNLNHFAYEIYY